MGARAELHGEGPEASHPSGSSSASKKSPAGACQHLCLRSLAGRRRWSGTSWSIWPSLPPWCKSLIFLCRSWWTTWWMPCGSWISRLPSRLSMCPRSLALRVLRVLLFLSRRQRTVGIALRIAEQIVGIPAPRGRVQGFLPQQSPTATSSYLERISERTVEQIVDFPSSVGCLGQGSSSSAGPADKDFTGFFFALFPGTKKCDFRSRPESERARQCQLMDRGGL